MPSHHQNKWNAHHEARRLAKEIPKASLWATDPNGINQEGCVYTAQGFEFEYVGVIFGKDLVYSFEKNTWVANPDNSFDTIVKRDRQHFLDYIKHTYKVLMTRGMKGCYVYFEDKSTAAYFKSRLEN